MQVGDVNRFGRHQNAFGFLRLVFASLVILSHTPELIDGNRHREILTRLFGTLSFGELAVDGFFLISGYLITGSYLKQAEIWSYLRKRIARIYPAFIAASLACIFVVAPLGGGRIDFETLRVAALRIVILQGPDVPGAFANSPYPFLNGAMWTIAYEFRCYLLVPALGLLGIYKRSWALVALTAATILIDTLGSSNLLTEHSQYADLHNTLRLLYMFLVGTIFYVRRDSIKFTRPKLMLAASLLFPCLFVDLLAEPALAVLGGYLLFAAAESGGRTVLARMNNDDDISYGLYLYAWPIEKLLLWFAPSLNIAIVGLVTWIGAMALGALSWFSLEKPIMQALRSPRSAVEV